MKNYVQPFVLMTSLGLALLACVEPYAPGGTYDTNLVTIDGTLTDLSEPQVVRLRRSRSTKTGSYSEPIRGASLEVLVNGLMRLALRERAPGDYHLPDGFQTVPGARYQLRFQLSDGTRYESTPEQVPAGVGIDKVYDGFDPEAIGPNLTGSGPRFRPGHRVYLDLRDPAGTPNFYRWTWTLWEKQDVCATCDNGLYFFGIGCRRTNTGTFYDYFCEQRCWAIQLSESINVMADNFADGRTVTGREVARIPFYNRSGALLEIRQQSLSIGAFRYLRLLADQAQNTGSLADTPPASIFGNVSNVANPQDRTVGYFTAAAITKTRYWLSRENAPRSIPTIGLLGRPPQPEPPSPFPPRPPLASCTPDEFRTPVQPEGWRN